MISNICREILSTLEEGGYDAYIVGGCVRDMLMKRQFHDYDITTSASPEQVTELFGDKKVIPTGIQHGTVTVISGGIPFEITTFRVDGEYSDSRRPDKVIYTSDLREDLARRDFTMNAIAMDLRGDIYDPFSGEEDIRRGVIRCVGDPEKRFTEDALRILRAVRFASQLGFSIESKTSEALLALRGRLDKVSRERVRDELDKLISGEYSTEVMLGYREIIGQIVPELRESFDFQQHSRYHKYDVYEHTVRAIAGAPDELLMKRTMLLHDVAKPKMFRLDENGVGHFKQHAEVGAEMAVEIMKRLKYDNATIETIRTLIYYHSRNFHSPEEVRLLASEIGTEMFCKLMEVKKADNRGKNAFVLEENPVFDRYAEYVRRLEAEGFCFKLSQLAVNGSDIAALGAEGPEIGRILKKLHRLVVTGEAENDHAVLTEKAKEEIE